MVNLTQPELAETRAPSLPNASPEALRDLRAELCSQSASRDFKLQSHQRFLRRVLSPDSPIRNLLMVHGTGTGKTCTAIQIAEEYILRPEFQEKRVLVLANPAIQENFKKEIFDIQRAVVDKDGLLMSKQCTGRRYLEILQRVQSEPEQWTDKTVREQLKRLADKVLQEFQEFRGQEELANELQEKQLNGSTADVDGWIHKHFDDRLVIIDEAHNLKVESVSETTTKKASAAIERIIKVAKNMTLVLLTATPMYNTQDEIIYYFNLFLWNDRRQPAKKIVTVSEIFKPDGSFQEGKEEVFRGWCQDQISFLKGDNPFTFPFRLPPPPELVAKPDRRDWNKNRAIPAEEQRKQLVLTQSFVQGFQEQALQNPKTVQQEDQDTICVLPERKTFRESFQAFPATDEALFQQRGPKFLAPSQVAQQSSKFALIQKIIQESKGIVFVYSNWVEQGTNLFAMCLEEHGFEPAIGRRMLKSTSEEFPRGSRGKQILASDLSENELRRGLEMLRARTNLNGEEIRVIVGSPKISEGVDLKQVRQVHILDPWDNMSRIEQGIGRGIRTCSHAMLPFEEQNCTVYLHVCRFSNSTKEIRDEQVQRAFVEAKASKIAKVKQVIQESAMDCPLQNDVNTLPEDWRKLPIKQRRSQGNQEVTLTLDQMASPNFGSEPGTLTCKVTESTPDPNHERPLSAYLDVRDELGDKFRALFEKKPVWTKEDLLKHPKIRGQDPEVVVFLLQDAIETGFVLKNAEGELGHLESRDGLYAFAKGWHDTFQDRTLPPQEGHEVPLRLAVTEAKPMEVLNFDTIRKTQDWKGDAKTYFSTEVLDWQIVDQVLTPEQRMDHLFNLDQTDPPIQARRIKVGTMQNLGESNIYNADKEPITPIGKEKDAIDAWISDLKKRYLAQKNTVFGTMNEKNLLAFNLDDKASEVKLAERSKNIGGRACRSQAEPLLNKFSEWLGKPFPSGVNTKEARCQQLGLLIRDAILKGKDGVTWWTPEEWSYLTQPEISAEIRGKK